MSLPRDSTVRKTIPIYRGFLKIFPDAIAAVAQLTAISTEKHNPGGDIGWVKEKSTDELDALLRHMLDDVNVPLSRDDEGALHAVKIAWRGMANLQRLSDSGVNVYAVINSALADMTTLTIEEIESYERTGSYESIKKFAMREA